MRCRSRQAGSAAQAESRAHLSLRRQDLKGRSREAGLITRTLPPCSPYVFSAYQSQEQYSQKELFVNILIINIVSVTVFIGVLALLMPLLRPGKSQIHIPDRFKSARLGAVEREITHPKEATP